MKWSALNYAEAALAVFALLFGSLIYERFEVSNIFINLAIIALLASPIATNRFLLTAGLGMKAIQAVVAGYAVCSVVMSVALGAGYASDYLFVPILCAISLPLLRLLSNQSATSVPRQVQAGAIAKQKRTPGRLQLAGRMVFNLAIAPLLLGGVIVGVAVIARLLGFFQ